jgi:hypothetical protein
MMLNPNFNIREMDCKMQKQRRAAVVQHKQLIFRTVQKACCSCDVRLVVARLIGREADNGAALCTRCG